MELRRGRPSDERRRRVMLDDSRLASASTEGEDSTSEDSRPKAVRKSKSYPDDALASRQMRLTDLLPVRIWAIFSIVCLGFVAATGIHFAHLHRDLLNDRFGAAASIFDVQTQGSLGRGLSVLLIAGAMFSSFLIYSLRRHKMDDYRGHYGIWLWVAIVLTMLTGSEFTGITGLVEATLERIAPVGLLSRLPLIIHTIVALGALLFLARLGAEMQRCRSALAVLALLVASVGLVVALEAGWRPKGLEIPEELLALHARLASRGLLFLMLMVYGRYTRLDAQGNIKIRERKPRKKAMPVVEKVEASAEELSEAAKHTPAPPKPTVATAPEKITPKPQEKPLEKSVEKPVVAVKPAVITSPKPALTLGQKPSEDNDDENGGNGRLSRAERRRMKQLGKAA